VYLVHLLSVLRTLLSVLKTLLSVLRTLLSVLSTSPGVPVRERRGVSSGPDAQGRVRRVPRPGRDLAVTVLYVALTVLYVH